MNQTNHQQYFFCYDVNLRNYIVSNGYANQITYALHPKTKNQFWLFAIDESLDAGIKKYRKSMKQANVN